MSPNAHSATPSRLRLAAESETIHTIPVRLDRLPWSRFHLLMVIALGVTWILDGLEVTIVGTIGPVLENPQTLALSAAQVGNAASSYAIGAVIGALLFGWLTDRFGRRFVFHTTLVVYLTGVLLTAVSWNFLSFAVFRGITGLGIGGEYAAINSAIDELIPAGYRGRVDLVVNGSFWPGAVAGSSASLLFLDPSLIAPNLGWRLGFGIGGLLGLGDNAVPSLFGYLIGTGSQWALAGGYIFAAALMLIAALAEAKLGVDAEGRSLEKHRGSTFQFMSI